MTELVLADTLSEFHVSQKIKRFSMRWGGQAGDGLQSTGNLIQKYLNRLGYHLYGFPGTQSTIRGGHVWQHIEFSSSPLSYFTRRIDLLIAMQPIALKVHLRDIKDGGLLVINSDKVQLDEWKNHIEARRIQVIEVPMAKLAREIEMRVQVLANTVAVGVMLALLDLDIDIFKETLIKRFNGKDSILEMNYKAIEVGIEYYKKNYTLQLSCEKGENTESNDLVISGNEMIAIGAAAAGLKFLAQYPITPASSILTYLTKHAKEFGIVVRQSEDELAAAMMCIGASYAGARSMTASSGPGLSLMGEAFGYASMTETPIVIVNSMRAGPATGVPTKMEQADLNSMIHLSHGESPRIILAPRNIAEAFEMTVRAFNLADEYQMPVILLSDFALSESTTNVKPFDLDVEIRRGKIWTGPTEQQPVFKRHGLTSDGISYRAFPPTKDAMYIAVGAEHDEFSHSLSGNRCGTPQSWELREEMFNKRFRKLEILREEMQVPEFYGKEKADYTLISWGSTQGPLQEAVDYLNKEGPHTWNMLCFSEIFPLPYQKIKGLLEETGTTIFFEVNFTGQFENLIHQHLNWKADYRLHPLSGETQTADIIIKDLRQLMREVIGNGEANYAVRQEEIRS
ncbi:MAG: 2-oxoacid:acceptor oxidoreductase subunit alpha [Candidatus Heimdallarchaeota archaeon]|nr:2-oxoacid:acceptor oxidoreductase subunit alpha [Candidatus Heimdallarchaeota archaeon]